MRVARPEMSINKSDPIYINSFQNKRRVHVGGSFVLVYEIDEEEKTVTLFDFDHHDNIYKAN